MENNKIQRVFRGDRLQDKIKLKFLESVLSKVSDRDGEIATCIQALNSIGFDVLNTKRTDGHCEYPVCLSKDEAECFEIAMSIIKDHFVFTLANLSYIEESFGIRMDYYDKHRRRNPWSISVESDDSKADDQHGGLH